ncbi:hypothetical protein CPC08DRAFT_119520 [Agrocybe pediades]|nr:hypothetical protein CPC08DRAFT_119520 [Agrocybe pediades]
MLDRQGLLAGGYCHCHQCHSGPKTSRGLTRAPVIAINKGDLRKLIVPVCGCLGPTAVAVVALATSLLPVTAATAAVVSAAPSHIKGILKHAKTIDSPE